MKQLSHLHSRSGEKGSDRRLLLLSLSVYTAQDPLQGMVPFSMGGTTHRN